MVDENRKSRNPLVIDETIYRGIVLDLRYLAKEG
jgi:hypothetical protein